MRRSPAPTINVSRAGKGGITGTAVLFGTAALYLVYVGVKDVPFFDGMRAILRKEKPKSKNEHTPFSLITPTDTSSSFGEPGGAAQRIGNVFAGDTGIDKLVGFAANAYPKLKAKFPGLKMGGWRAEGSVADSDHPKGKAIDVMTTDNATAQQIIRAFKMIPGAKYYIWNRRIGNISRLWAEHDYDGPSPHTDHVHLSFF